MALGPFINARVLREVESNYEALLFSKDKPFGKKHELRPFEKPVA